MVLTALVAALTIAGAPAAKAGLADCLWSGLPVEEQTAVLDLRLVPDGGARMVAAEAILNNPETRVAAERCGLTDSFGARLAMMVFFLRHSAEAELDPRYDPHALDAAFEAVQPGVVAALLDPEGHRSSEELAKPFLEALGRPPEGDRAALIRYFDARTLGLIPEVALREMEDQAAREQAEEARRAGDAPFVAREVRPAWEAASRLPCLWRELFGADDSILYDPGGLAGVVALRDIYPDAGGREACRATDSDFGRLADYFGVRYAERWLIRRFDAVRLDEAYRALSPADQARLRRADAQRPGAAAAALARYRAMLGVGDADPDEAVIHGYAVHRSRVTD